MFKIVKSSTSSLDVTKAKVIDVVTSSNDADYVNIYIDINKQRARACANVHECIGLKLAKPGKTLVFHTTKQGFVKRITA